MEALLELTLEEEAAPFQRVWGAFGLRDYLGILGGSKSNQTTSQQKNNRILIE